MAKMTADAILAQLRDESTNTDHCPATRELLRQAANLLMWMNCKDLLNEARTLAALGVMTPEQLAAEEQLLSNLIARARRLAFAKVAH